MNWTFFKKRRWTERVPDAIKNVFFPKIIHYSIKIRKLIVLERNKCENFCRKRHYFLIFFQCYNHRGGGRGRGKYFTTFSLILSLLLLKFKQNSLLFHHFLKQFFNYRFSKISPPVRHSIQEISFSYNILKNNQNWLTTKSHIFATKYTPFT